MGFKINYYNPCVANKWIKGRQMTITWHVDDLKISYQDSKEVSRMIRCLRKLYGQHGDLTVSRGKVHEYLVMTLDYRQKEKVIIDMTKCTNKTHKMFLEELSGQVSLPAAEHLFKVREDAKKLAEKERQTFHTIVSRSLFLGKQGRPYVQTMVTFFYVQELKWLIWMTGKG